MLRVAICDDRPEELEKIQKACETYINEKTEKKAVVETYYNPMDCLDGLEKSGGWDIALLDICMPGISGVQVAKEILRQHPKTEIIFLTTSDEYAVEAFSVGAAHYITKPFEQKDFDTGMDRVMDKFEKAPPKYLYINDKGSVLHKVDMNDILYIESFRNGRTIHTSEGDFTETKTTLQGIQDELTKMCPNQFVSPYRGYIVNFEAVKSITKDGIVLKNKEIVPIKPDSFRKLRESYIEYEFSKED